MAPRSPPPSRRRGSPPALMDDLVGEILLRIPPDEPAHLVRAAVVCKPWRRILTDPAFLRRYRAFHRTPPLLGFISNLDDDEDPVPRFVPTSSSSASPCSPPAFGCDTWWALDCRHGRALIHYMGRVSGRGLIVWDPISGDQQELDLPMAMYGHAYLTGAVLCAAAGCDHLGCRGGPFLVVLVGCDRKVDVTSASVYSSENGDWSALTTVHLHSIIELRPSLLAGDALYFSLLGSRKILKFSLVGGDLSVIARPEAPGNTVMTAVDGRLGFASVEDYSLYLWSWEPGAEGNDGWAQCRVIKLDTVLPIHDTPISLDVVGFTEGLNSIIISTNIAVYTVELKSGQARKDRREGVPLRHHTLHELLHSRIILWTDCHRHEDARIHP
ncbi:hypothetical protein ACP70R_015188 [Stipagrostis hirtigluma subsp. patula]